MVATMYRVQVKENDLMMMLGLNETIDQLAMANSVHCYYDVLRRAFQFEVGVIRIKGAEKDTEEAG